MLFFIGIPLLSLAVLLAAANYYASVDIAWFVLAFFAVGHHLPGFMRVYGERELFDRHKAQFLIAPVVIAALVGWSVYNGHLGFFILLALWDMWHFFMRHYGLMRIYEVKQPKPFNLSSRLDWLLLAVWYGYIIIASPHYLINFLERCHRYGFGFYTWIRPEQVHALREWALYAALALSVLYVVNALREWSCGIPVVWPKLFISLTTFATVYYAYIALEDIILGYAIVALAHDVQYFAIVWIYNNGVLKRSRELGASFFRFLFADGRFRLVLLYVVLILAYGSIEAIGRMTGSHAIYDVVKVVIVTSAFMHYYYDGFIWKVRKHSMRRNLVQEAADAGDGADNGLRWWYGLRPPTGQKPNWAGWPFFFGFGGRSSRCSVEYASELGRQLLYFGVPILFFAWTDTAYKISDIAVRDYLVQLTPGVANSHDDLGVSLTRAGELEQAIAAHLQAIETDAGYARAHTHLGIAYSLKGDRERAIAAHLQAIEVDAEMPQAHYNLGVDYFGLERLPEARAAFARAIALDDGYSRAHLALSEIFSREGDWTLARQHRELAVEADKIARRSELSRNALPWTTGTALGDH